MALTAGTQFGNYEVLAPLGKGGMGEVYRAHDRNLGRDVAIKVLPESQHLDPETLKRFEREARLLASVNHPNIATLHGLELIGGSQALVMELVEGETLGAMLARLSHGLPLRDVIDIAQQIAAALDAAHDSGIVHRDLKPANVMIRPDGTVKVLDFGIARALTADGHVGAVTQTPNAVIGTPSYMSPEQASGGTVDRRTDIWSFGCLLYEMLTGQCAFDGETNSRIIARVLEREPDWKRIPRNVPARIRSLLRQCLEKDVRRRRRDAGDLRLELDLATSEPEDSAEDDHRRSRTHWRWAASTAALAVISTAAAAYFYFADEPATPLSTEITTPASREPDQFALAPNGRYLVFVASASADSIVQILYLRDLETGEVRTMPDTRGAKYPCWSPNNRSIAYFDAEDLYRVDIEGGAPVPLAPAQNGAGCSWSVNDMILFAPNSVMPLFGIAAAGGDYAEVTRLDSNTAGDDRAQQTNHRFPSFLPDGNRFLYYVSGGDDVNGIHIGSVDGTVSKRLTTSYSNAVFVAPNWVIYDLNGALVERQLDLGRMELTDESRTLALSRHAISRGNNHLAFSASATGLMAFRDAPEAPSVLTTYDHQGVVIASDAYLNGLEISPNQRFLGFDGYLGSNRDVYVRDLQRGGSIRVTDDGQVEGFPVFSPDSGRVIYERQRNDDKLFELWQAQINRPDSQELLYRESSTNLIPLDWSSTEYLLYRQSNRDFLASDLLALPLAGDELTPIPVAVSPNEERLGEISPDGRWVTYDHLVRRGGWEVLVKSFPAGGDVHIVSTEAGGFAPRWSDDGSRIHFISMDGAMMEAEFSAATPEAEVGRPVQLFPTRITGQSYNHAYAVARDGSFLVNETVIDPFPPPITIISNWKP